MPASDMRRHSPPNVLNFIFGELRPRIATKINGLAGLVTF
jgi:hypothetical protein